MAVCVTYFSALKYDLKLEAVVYFGQKESKHQQTVAQKTFPGQQMVLYHFNTHFNATQVNLSVKLPSLKSLFT